MNTKQLKEKILSLAIQGKLVPQDSNDEPAIELLKRINPNIQPILEDIPFDIPISWCWVKLGSIISLLSGRDTEPDKYNDIGKGVPYITGASNFNQGNLLVNRWIEKPITISKLGDLLITCKGTVGEMAFNNIGEIHIARQIMAISSSINLSYIKYFFDFNLRSLETKANGLIPGISRNTVLTTLIPIPPLAEQHRITEKVESLFTLIDNIEKNKESIKENIKATRQKLLSMAIRGELVPQDPNDEPAIELLKRINPKFTPLQYDEPLPQGWSATNLSIIAKISTGNSINEQEKKNKYMGLYEGYNYIATKDLSFDSVIDYNNGVKIPYNTDFRIAHSGSTLLCIEGGSAGRKIGLLTEDVCYVNKLCAFETSSINNKYLYYYLQSPIFTAIFKSEINGLIGGVNQKKIKTIAIPIPPIDEQQRIVDRLELLFAQLDDLEKNTEKNT